MSELNETLYRTFVSPWMQTIGTPWSAAALEWLHPMRTSRYLLSEAFNPWMRGVAVLAASIAKDRHPLAKENALIEREHKVLAEITDVLTAARKVRDAVYEQAFNVLFATRGGRTPEHEPGNDGRPLVARG